MTMTLYELTVQDDSGVFVIKDIDRERIAEERRRYEGMGMRCRVRVVPP